MKMVDEPIRIAHVIGKLNAAGVEAVVNNYYRFIDHSKYQFDYFIDSDSNCQPPQELIDMGARYYVIPPYQKLPQHIKVLTKYFKQNKYQIVHSGMNTLAPISLFCAWKAGVPIRINHNHSTAGKGETKKNILKYALRPFAKCFATHYAACSKYAGKWLFGNKMIESGKVNIFNNAINVDRYKYNPDIRAEVRHELGIDNKFVVGHVGRFCYQKNHNFLIDIFKAVHDQSKDSILLLIGIGELVYEIKEKVNRLGLMDSVLFLGARNDVNRLYQAMDVFVLPSFYEGLPVVGVEAQSAGLPCVFSDKMTKETILLNSTIMLSLNAKSYDWAKEILKRESFIRQNVESLIREKCFDIKTEGITLTQYYDSILKQSNVTKGESC